METYIIPKYVDEIIIDNRTKKNVKLIQSVGLSFDSCGECALTMEFYDGIAYEVNGTGLIMRYPKLSEIAKSKGKQRAICDYTGIYDETINQFDVALKYGVLELSKNPDDKVIHTTLDKQQLRDETLTLLSVDMYKDIYELSDYMDYNRVVRILSKLADQFEKELDWKGEEDDRDYIIELKGFEEKALRRLEMEIDIVSKWD